MTALDRANETLDKIKASVEAESGKASAQSKQVKTAKYMSAAKVQMQDGTWRTAIKLKGDDSEMVCLLSGDDAQLLYICRTLLDLQVQVKQLNGAGH